MAKFLKESKEWDSPTFTFDTTDNYPLKLYKGDEATQANSARVLQNVHRILYWIQYSHHQHKQQ